jgi:hypothetical protein
MNKMMQPIQKTLTKPEAFEKGEILKELLWVSM